MTISSVGVQGLQFANTYGRAYMPFFVGTQVTLRILMFALSFFMREEEGKLNKAIIAGAIIAGTGSCYATRYMLPTSASYVSPTDIACILLCAVAIHAAAEYIYPNYLPSGMYAGNKLYRICGVPSRFLIVAMAALCLKKASESL